jgi:hypothetical protein
VPSQSVEAATREEAIEAAREEYGPSVKIVGVRRIRSGGVLGFFAAERYVAEVDPSARKTPTGAGSARRTEPADSRAHSRAGSGASARPASRARAAGSMDDRMSELADLLGPSSAQPPIGLYSAGGVAQTPAIDDLVAQRRPRTFVSPAPETPERGSRAAAAETPARGFRAVAAERSAASGAAPVHRAAAPAAPRTGATPRNSGARAARTGSPAFAPGSFAAAVQAAAAGPAAVPFTPSRYRPTLDRFVGATPAPAAGPEPSGPSPFTAALARMVADRSVSAAVSDAVERSAAEAEVDATTGESAEEQVFRVPAEEWVDESELDEPVVAAPVPAPAAAAPSVPVVAVPTAPVVPTAGAQAELPTEPDQRTALQSALQSVLRPAGRPAPDMERLLEGVLERVLSGDVPADDPARGRHRFPEPTPASAPVTASEPATTEMTAVRPDASRLLPAPAVAVAVAEPDGLVGLSTDLLDEELVDDRSAAGWAAGRAGDVRAETARVHELRRDVVDQQGNEVRDHRESLVLPSSMAAWLSLARTASDPAPLSMDATMILPPLSLLPPQRMPAIGGAPLLPGRPAVPPARRPPAAGPSTASRPALSVRPAVPAPTQRGSAARAALEAAPSEVARASAEIGTRLATVTRLVPAPSPSVSAQLAPYGFSPGDELVVQLLALGVPEFLIAPGFATDAAIHGLYAALTRSLSDRLAPAPEAPVEPGSVLVVVGPGAETLAAARSLAVSLRLDPTTVQWATPGDAAFLAPEHSRIMTLETATARQQVSEGAGTVTIVAVDAPLRTGGGSWLTHMLSIWAPEAVWGVVDATRKLEDVVPWLDGLPRLDAVMLQDTEATADPATVLSHLTAPVARIDGARATAHRWASLLCERLEEL